jgi:Flp pilus assembly protein TadD
LWYGLGSAQQRLGNQAEAQQAYRQALQQPDLSANLRAQIERRLSGQ